GGRCAAPAAAVGDRTADACRVASLRVVFTPSLPSGAALAEELPLPLGAVLLARSDRAGREPVAVLLRRGAVAGEIVAYRTVAFGPDVDPAGDVVVFASPSAVEGFCARGASATRAVAIGPATAARVRTLLRLEPRVAAPSDDAIVAAVQLALEERHDLVHR
ncbi:MAG: uroporphyrinogen-III synthase, partial [Chloroflexota bacterium]|nr:uroporphyrinogen-III synthase [Chloroflexota bacterium]